MSQSAVRSATTHSHPAHSDTAPLAQAQLGVEGRDTCVRPLTVPMRSAGAGARVSMGSPEAHDAAARRQQAEHGSGATASHPDELAHAAASVHAPASAPAAAIVQTHSLRRK